VRKRSILKSIREITMTPLRVSTNFTDQSRSTLIFCEPKQEPKSLSQVRYLLLLTAREHYFLPVFAVRCVLYKSTINVTFPSRSSFLGCGYSSRTSCRPCRPKPCLETYRYLLENARYQMAAKVNVIALFRWYYGLRHGHQEPLLRGWQFHLPP
jgi:hypothetical protein